MNDIVPFEVWMASISAVVSVTCAAYLVVNTVVLRRALRDMRGGERADWVFGAIVGYAIMTLGLLGVFKFHFL